MRALIALACLGGVACAQVPDVRVKLDITGTYRTDGQGPTSLRLYSMFGRPSILGFTFYLESGLRAYASERLQRIPGSPDRDPLDEYYIEDEGIWRLGKQYLPFGSEQILRESVLAARGDTNLIFENLPITIAFCDGGPGAQRGVVARAAFHSFGVSAAQGKHFGIATTAFGNIRRPEDTPGKNNGWSTALGADFVRRSGAYTTRVEFVALRGGEGDTNTDLDVLDFSFTAIPSRYQSFTVGLTPQGKGHRTTFRFQPSIYLTDTTTLEPGIRVLGEGHVDLGVALRVRF